MAGFKGGKMYLKEEDKSQIMARALAPHMSLNINTSGSKLSLPLSSV